MHNLRKIEECETGMERYCPLDVESRCVELIHDRTSQIKKIRFIPQSLSSFLKV